MPNDLNTGPIHLGLGATAVVQPPFTGAAEWYMDYGQRNADDGAEDSSDPGQSEQQTAANDAEPPESEPGDADEQQGDAEEPGEPPLQAAASPEDIEDWASEQAADQWLRRIPQDPGGLLRRKFLYQYNQGGTDQDGNPIYAGREAEPW